MNTQRQDPTPDRERAEAWRILIEAIGEIVAYAPQVAAAKRALYEEYVKAGFDEKQALELCKDILPK